MGINESVNMSINKESQIVVYHIKLHFYTFVSVFVYVYLQKKTVQKHVTLSLPLTTMKIFPNEPFVFSICSSF